MGWNTAVPVLGGMRLSYVVIERRTRCFSPLCRLESFACGVE